MQLGFMNGDSSFLFCCVLVCLSEPADGRVWTGLEHSASFPGSWNEILAVIPNPWLGSIQQQSTAGSKQVPPTPAPLCSTSGDSQPPPDPRTPSLYIVGQLAEKATSIKEDVFSVDKSVQGQSCNFSWQFKKSLLKSLWEKLLSSSMERMVNSMISIHNHEWRHCGCLN